MIYLPEHFAIDDSASLRDLIAAYPLATLVTLGPGGIAANHIPFILDIRGDGDGTLIGHVARSNDVWREGFHDGESLVIFQSVQAYVTPNWYPTKAETHEVVPTWNYAVVHAYGPLIVHDDAKWVRGAAGRLTKQMEALQSSQWKMADAPARYLEDMLENIVGIEIPIVRLIGKWKASQNRGDADRAGVITGLRSRDERDDAAMADLIATKPGNHPRS